MRDHLIHTCLQNPRQTGESGKLAKVLEEIMSENFLNVTKDINPQIQGANPKQDKPPNHAKTYN